MAGLSRFLRVVSESCKNRTCIVQADAVIAGNSLDYNIYHSSECSYTIRQELEVKLESQE